MSEKIKALMEAASPMERQELVQLLAEMRRREHEALKIFRPIDYQLEFLKSTSRTRIVRGGNRSGKTAIIQGVETAYWLMANHPYRELPKRVQKGEATLLCVGLTWEKVGQFISPYLFQPGMFYMYDYECPQCGTEVCETLNAERKIVCPTCQKALEKGDPWLEEYRKPAPPLIPERMYRAKDMVWASRSRNYLASVKLKTGNTIVFSTVYSDRQGDRYDRVAIDEEIMGDPAGDAAFVELQRSLIDYQGTLDIAATPTRSSKFFRDLVDQAQRGVNGMAEFRWNALDNYHLDTGEIERQFSGLSPAARRMRITGEFYDHEGLCVPQFNRREHVIDDCVPPVGVPLYEAYDPGFTDPFVVLFMFVLPPRSANSGIKFLFRRDGQVLNMEVDGQVVVWEEFHQPEVLLDEVVRYVKDVRLKSGRPVTCAIGDRRSNIKDRITGEGLWSRLAREGISLVMPAGPDNVEDGLGVVRQAFYSSRLLICRRCIGLIRDLERYSYKHGKPDPKNYTGGPDALRNALSHPISWRAVERNSCPEPFTYDWFVWRERRQKEKLAVL